MEVCPSRGARLAEHLSVSCLLRVWRKGLVSAFVERVWVEFAYGFALMVGLFLVMRSDFEGDLSGGVEGHLQTIQLLHVQGQDNVLAST